jgi:chromosome partitioning protein
MYIVTMLSFKGGVGKTTSAVHLAASAYHRGLRVLLLDLDFQGAAAKRLIHFNYEAELGAGEWLREARSFDQVVVRARPLDAAGATARLDIIPGSASLKDAEVELTKDGSSRRLNNLLLDLADAGITYDLVVIDTHPSDDLLTANAVDAADVVLCPFSAEPDAYIGPKTVLQRLKKAEREQRRKIPVFLLPTQYSLKNGSQSYDLVEAVVRAYGRYPEGLVLPHIIDSDVLKNTGALAKSIYESRPGHATALQYDTVFDIILESANAAA